MELELMFSDQKWNILKELAQDKFSPLQLAEKLNTTMANISQQLRLLEAANLVKKEKIKNREKGKPRTLFSLSNNHAYIIPAMSNFADKKLLKATDHQRITLGIWFIEDLELQSRVEKFYWKIEQYLAGINVIAINNKKKELIIIADQPDEIVKAVLKNKVIDTKVMTLDSALKFIKASKDPFNSINDISIIFDRNNMIPKKIGGGQL